MNMSGGVRLDRWLWSARFFKTRQAAADAVGNGRVLLNNRRTRPARTVRAGDTVRIHKQAFLYQLTVLKLADKRTSPQVAATLYREDPDSLEKRLTLARQLRAQSAPVRTGKGRPSKRDRRLLERLRQPGASG